MVWGFPTIFSSCGKSEEEKAQEIAQKILDDGGLADGDSDEGVPSQAIINLIKSVFPSKRITYVYKGGTFFDFVLTYDGVFLKEYKRIIDREGTVAKYSLVWTSKCINIYKDEAFYAKAYFGKNGWVETITFPENGNVVEEEGYWYDPKSNSTLVYYKCICNKIVLSYNSSDRIVKIVYNESIQSEDEDGVKKDYTQDSETIIAWDAKGNYVYPVKDKAPVYSDAINKSGYFDAQSPFEDYLLCMLYYAGVIGKGNSNLLSKFTPYAGGRTYNCTYSFDGEGCVTEMRADYHEGFSSDQLTYRYYYAE